jgi:hypothetical protein
MNQIHPGLSETITDIAKQALRESGAAGFLAPIAGTAPQIYFAVGTPESIRRVLLSEPTEQIDVDAALVEEVAMSAYFADVSPDPLDTPVLWDDLPEREKMRWRKIGEAVSWTVAARCADIADRHDSQDEDRAGVAIRAAYGV